MTNDEVLEQLADAVTAVANARRSIPPDRLLRETALNILILARIAANLVGDREYRDKIDSQCDQLVDSLRAASDCGQ